MATVNNMTLQIAGAAGQGVEVAAGCAFDVAVGQVIAPFGNAALGERSHGAEVGE